MIRFVPHCHTEMSNFRLLDCIVKLPDLIKRGKEIGLAGLAVTDHETIAQSIRVCKLQKENPDFKIAIGNEIYLTDVRQNGIKYWHQILIAKDAIGHKQLRQLSSIAWMNSYWDRGMERVPTLKSELKNIVMRDPGHLLATSACLGGELSNSIIEMEKARQMEDNETATIKYNQIVEYMQFMDELFGDDFYVEVAPAASKDQIIANNKLVQIAHVFNKKVVIGDDAHMLKKEDRFIHKAYLNSKGGERETDAFYEYAYLQDEEDLRKNLEPSIGIMVNEMCRNSMEMFDKIEIYNLLHNQTIPSVPVKNYPEVEYESDFTGRYKKEWNFPTIDDLLCFGDIYERYWINECLNNLSKIKKYNTKYLQELEEEARVKRVIGEKLGTNMFKYPITLKYYIDMIWECGSLVGAGRGSSCAALNHYLLGITQLDPIEWNLPFFRYMNDERTELGDIDIDICPSKKGTIVKKIKEERGRRFNPDIDSLSRKNLGCTLVATYGTEQTKSAVLTACFVKNTKVKTLNGEKYIQDITSEDYVYTTNGWEQVMTPTRLNWKNDFITIDGNYGFEDEITCTNNHEFLVLPKTNEHRLEGKINNTIINNLIPEYKTFSDSKKTKYRNYIRDIQPIWIEAKDLKEKDYLLSKIDNTDKDILFYYLDFSAANQNSNFIKSIIEINNDFCELLGIWLAEGSLNRSMFSFTISSEEIELKDRILFLMEQVFGLKDPYINNRDNHSIVIQYTSATLRDFLYSLFEIKNFSEINQYNKRIPKKLLYINPLKQLQIFKGWIIGDGTYRQRINQEWRGSKELKGTTVSRQLCLDMKHILHRNYLNPSIIREKRANKAEVYNIVFSGKVAQKIGYIKYGNYETTLNIDWDDRLGKDLPCVYNGELYMRYQIKTKKIISNNENKEVYCLMVPSQNFTISDVIVHNCRGYRSEEYPDGIDNDEAQYIASLIPSERGFLWPLEDVINGNKDKEREPVHAFVNEVNMYPGLLDIIFGIVGLINKRSSHASGVILFDEDPYEFGCFMRTPKGEVITQYDLHDCEAAGMVKYDFLVTEVQDKLAQAIRFLQEDGVIEDNGINLRSVYDKYFHPNVLPMDDKKVWDAIQNGTVINVFQFDSEVGSQAAKKIKPTTILELTDANGLMRLMTAEKGAETPMEKYIRFKNNLDLWYKEMRDFGLTPNERDYLEPYFKSSYGVPPSQEQLMLMLMDKNICGFTLAEANSARKIVGKKQMSKIPELHQMILEKASSEKLGKYVWENGVGPQMG